MYKDQMTITRLRELENFSKAVDRLLKGEELNNKYSCLLLASAVALIKSYQDDRDKTQSIEFAYWIILNYSLCTGDMRPLLEFSYDFGLYPICKVISNMTTQTGRHSKLIEEFANETIDYTFTSGHMVSTIEQANRRMAFLQSANTDMAYVAPTSFGKTRQLLERAINDISGKRTCIIVPTKSLLHQTKNDLKELGLSFKLISHDEMLSPSDLRFVAVLTQERAMRILETYPSLSFSSLFIDEAHRIFDKDDRAILLTRVIRECRNRDSNMNVVYLSPVVDDVKHLSNISGREVKELRICFSMKEPKYYYYNSDTLFAYNRFFDTFSEIGKYHDIWDCIANHASEKNLIYINTPKKIVAAAKSLSKYVSEVVSTPEFEETIGCLVRYVHNEYDEIECLRHGVIYLHGRMPEGIKEYLVNKIARLPQIRYVFANTVILEGMNLPIQSIFILNGKNLQKTNLINLIGRAGRLNEVFSREPDLSKLQPEIYFVESEWNSKGIKMGNLIKRIRSSNPEDVIKNPVMRKADGLPLSDDDSRKIEIEEFIFSVHNDIFGEFKALLYRSGIGNYYNLTDKVVGIISDRLSMLNKGQYDIFDVIWKVFIKDLENYIEDRTLLRLRLTGTRNYYRSFISDRNSRSLSERIARSLAVFKRKAEGGYLKDRIEYMGPSFGEIDKDGLNLGPLWYVDLHGKTTSQLVSYSLIKMGLEEDFLRYKLMKFARVLKKKEIITDSIYNIFAYGVDNPEQIELIKMGVPLPLVKMLAENDKLRYIEKDSYGNLQFSSQAALMELARDDFIRFELETSML